MANSVLSAGTSARGLTDSGETSGASSSEGRQLTVHFQYDSFLQMTLPCDPSQCGPRKPMVNSVLSDGTSDPWTHRLRSFPHWLLKQES
ncbi:uncharacterized protein LOC115281282 isoform X2 [Suricata suricatta]|uniref:uncharacterized protein LOC115281282 isoform X2 n=1 Tax=Suricata suricatta TaxID=37032 RepID=UPI0011553611|nr:uncharacterized protein LOC115281282 isoform X2 [Suricata suricatta]